MPVEPYLLVPGRFDFAVTLRIDGLFPAVGLEWGNIVKKLSVFCVFWVGNQEQIIESDA